MRRFKSSGHAQRFLSAFGIINSHFRVGRHLYTVLGYEEVIMRDSHYGCLLLADCYQPKLQKVNSVIKWLILFSE